MGYHEDINSFTWSAKTWIENDLASFADLFERVVLNEDRIENIAEDWFYENMPDLKGVYFDLLFLAIKNIDFNIVAEAIKDMELGGSSDAAL